MDSLHVGPAAARTGWSARMLRYLEQAGLVVPSRTPAGYRLYGLRELNQLRSLAELRTRPWFDATGCIAQKLVAPRGYDLRIVVARGRVIGAARRVAAPGEWRTNVALGARRETVAPPPDACAIAIAAADAIGGDLVGVDLLPADLGTWVVLEVNGAVDFTSAYSMDDDVFAAASAALSVGVEAAA